MRVGVLSSIALASFCACSISKRQEKGDMLDQVRARQYVEAWAKKVSANLQDLQTSNNDFFGRVGSLGFEYIASQRTLIARAYIFPHSAAVTSRPELLSWLNHLAANDPPSVSNGIFEATAPRWELDKEPSLFLRIEFKDGAQPESVVASRLLKLRDDSVIWRRTKLTEALDIMEKQRREKKRL